MLIVSWIVVSIVVLFGVYLAVRHWFITGLTNVSLGLFLASSFLAVFISVTASVYYLMQYYL